MQIQTQSTTVISLSNFQKSSRTWGRKFIVKVKHITLFYVCLKTKHEIFSNQQWISLYTYDSTLTHISNNNPISEVKQIVSCCKEKLPVVVNYHYKYKVNRLCPCQAIYHDIHAYNECMETFQLQLYMGLLLCLLV